jgi:hypothetical protein
MVEETRKAGRGRRVVLVASLALNLAALGAVGGWVLRHGIGPDHRHGPHAARMAQMGGPLTRALDAEGRDAVAAQLRGDRAAQKARRAALQASLMGLLADLRARPFDPARVEARLAAQRAQVTGRLEAGHEALLAHLAGMSDAGRAAYADRLEQTVHRWPQRHHR